MNTPFRALRSPRHGAGFTLIELMVTVSIVAILTAIAYPSYRNYVLRGQVVNATNGLAEMRANMERYYQDNRTYAGAAAPCATAATYGNFSVSCDGTPTLTTFSVQAVGSGPVNGFTYKVNQLNVRSTTIAAPAPSAWIITCTASWATAAGSC
jgi:prepilin-type N-terminal cleavage/methylation domain-containing protein